MRCLPRANVVGILGVMLGLVFPVFPAESPAADSLYDPDLHIFLTDDEIMAQTGLTRMPMTLRRESGDPAFTPDPNEDGTAIAYSTVARDPRTGRLKLWYLNYTDSRLRLAESDDNGRHWVRRGPAVNLDGSWTMDNASVAAVGPRLDSWFAGARFVATAYFNRPPTGHPVGIYAMRSTDGQHFDVRLPPILPDKGDRSSLCCDDVTSRYLFFTRPLMGLIPGFERTDPVRVRTVRMWSSEDLINWSDHGLVMKHDDQDPPDLQIYGVQVFRYGRGFLAFLEILHESTERLDTQLAWSDDGVRWQRVADRRPVLPFGGEGAWDSHFVVPTLNPPIPIGDRLLIPYVGGSTKHGSKTRHKKAVGLATLRKDAWVSLEAGRMTEAKLVTRPLPLTEPMKLEVNVNCHSGYLAVDVLTPAGDVVDGFVSQNGRLEHADSVRHQMTWGDRKAVSPIEGGTCLLRFTMKQASFFSFRWFKAAPTTTTTR